MKIKTTFGIWSVVLILATGPSFSQEDHEFSVDYVRVCDAYGAHYYYMPSSEVCVNADTGKTMKETEEGTVVGQTKLAERITILEEALKRLILEK